RSCPRRLMARQLTRRFSAASNRRRASWIAERFCRAHKPRLLTGSCRRRLGIYLASVSNRNQGRPVMAKVKVAVIVGTNRRDSINRKLAQALARLGEGRLAFHFVAIEDLPLYNQDLEGELPPSVVRFKSEITAADAVLFVTPEHNRS